MKLFRDRDYIKKDGTAHGPCCRGGDRSAEPLNDFCVNKDGQQYFGHAILPFDMKSVNFIAKSIEADIETVDELGERPFATTPLTPVAERIFAPLPIDLVSKPNRGN